MSWDAIVFDEVSPGEELPRHIDALFADQRRSWELLREGEAALAQVKTTELVEEGARVVVQSNTGRRKSTHAKVDARSIANRPCFLCPANMPAEERGIAYGELVVLPNPYPVLSRHCTIPSRIHRPQRLSGFLGMLFELARSVGPHLLVYYNGPGCGASAPDHFHFQACSAADIPILDEVRRLDGATEWHAHRSFGRRLLVRFDADPKVAWTEMERALEVLRHLGAVSKSDAGEEPMVNVMAHYQAGCYLTIVFPRAAHRPACYAAGGSAQIAVSPATLEMAGILVVAEPDQFGRVDAATARLIYDEVSVDEATFDRLVGELR